MVSAQPVPTPADHQGSPSDMCPRNLLHMSALALAILPRGLDASHPSTPDLLTLQLQLSHQSGPSLPWDPADPCLLQLQQSFQGGCDIMCIDIPLSMPTSGPASLPELPVMCSLHKEHSYIRPQRNLFYLIHRNQQKVKQNEETVQYVPNKRAR